MYFVGVDLSWSRKNKSGVVVLDNNKLVLSGVVSSDEEVIRCITSTVGSSPVMVAIDAPLLVPNESGSRLAEKELNNVFRKYEAGAHPANRSWFLRSSGCVRGEELVVALEKVGVVHDPLLSCKRCCFEVYPHPAMIRLFDLEKTLKYKPRKNRSYEERYEAFRRYQNHLSSLNVTNTSDLLSVDVSSLRGSALKEYEDVLDALLCAYIAKDVHERGADMFGTLQEGYILVPHARYV
ncbi:MAG: DUF429 domain-containing protein [Candidatus Woesearchaeota archaeon]